MPRTSCGPGGQPAAAQRAPALALALALAATVLSMFCGCTCDQPIPGTDAVPPPPACSDLFDNDLDGVIDYPGDPGCIDADDSDENDPAVAPPCSDGLDNDGDAFIDFGFDPGCVAASDPTEDETRQCNDALDNDGDAIIDFPFDPGCGTPGDDDEADPPPPACANAADDDGDTLVDYPDDPGCLDGADDVEDDPDPLPDCANAADDDGDGATDYPADPDCTAASDDSETPVLIGPCGPGVEILEVPADGDVTDAFFGATNDFAGSCGGLGGETIFHFALTTGGAVRFTTDWPETTLDTVLYVRSDCPDPFSELGCNDETDPAGDPGNHASTVLVPAAGVGDYYIFVDAFGPTDTGYFRLTIDRLVALGYPCDPADPLEVCETGSVCRALVSGGPTTCELPICGDGLDNDGDTLADSPDDPGCLHPFDPAEDDSVPPPACANGLDDDADAFSDFPSDGGCSSPSDGVEESLCGALTRPLADFDVTGSASGTNTDLLPDAGGSSCGGTGANDITFAFALMGDATRIVVDTAPETDLSLYFSIRTDCDAQTTDLDCNYGFFGDQPTIETGPVAAGIYYVWLHEVFSGTAGSWGLHVTADLAPGSPCDPGHLWQTCGSGTLCANDTPGPSYACRAAACANGADDEGAPDGLTDWPLDPGCATPSDDDETDPATPPACANGADDETDGRTDYPADPGCLAASDDDEAQECGPVEVPTEITTPVATAPGMDYPFVGYTPLGPSLFQGTCGGATAPESVYLVELAADATSLRAYTALAGAMTFTDTVLYVRYGNCEVGTQVACNDDFGTFLSDLTIAPAPAGFYFIFVDGYWDLQFGDFELHVEVTP